MRKYSSELDTTSRCCVSLIYSLGKHLNIWLFMKVSGQLFVECSSFGFVWCLFGIRFRIWILLVPVDCRCQPDGAKGCPGSWCNMNSGCVCEGVYGTIWFSRWRKGICPPQGRWASPTLVGLNRSKGQRKCQRLWGCGRTPASPALRRWGSWFSSLWPQAEFNLQREDVGLPGLHNHVSQFL